MLIRNKRPAHSRHSKVSIRLNWIDIRGVVRRHSSTLDCSRERGEHRSPCMRIRTWWPPSVLLSHLPPPLLPWWHVWNHSKPYTPEKTILCLNSVSWPLRLRVCKSHPPQSAFHQRVSPTLLFIDLSAFHLFVFELTPQPQRCWSCFFGMKLLLWPSACPLPSPTDILLLSFSCLLITAVDSPGWGCLSSTGLLTMQSTSLFLSSLFPPFPPSWLTHHF